MDLCWRKRWCWKNHICSLAILLAKQRENVLLISTDPAHNISDAFDQKFSKYPTMVQGFGNLYAMEIDPTVLDADEIPNDALGDDSSGLSGLAKELLSDFADSLPGIDEAKSFMQVMGLVKELQFSVVVFDTAPTGHTLRFLSMPALFQKGMGKVTQLKSQFGSVFDQLLPMLSTGSGDDGSFRSKMQESMPAIEQINEEFRDPDKATFVCVCIAEFLSLYETERLVQELTKLNIDVHNIVVNQLLNPEQDEHGQIVCKMCSSRHKIQSKYLEQIHDLYEDFHITECPLLTEEVRGREKVESFSKFLLGTNSK
ncbi:ATPase GET3-like isoform X2 [Halichondria panicea]|uniref:ATPase GET3-like isoform X2 n=1 Tax=Halichondria panicea TaxID=6063 RepID=UPI00312BC130